MVGTTTLLAIKQNEGGYFRTLDMHRRTAWQKYEKNPEANIAERERDDFEADRPLCVVLYRLFLYRRANLARWVTSGCRFEGSTALMRTVVGHSLLQVQAAALPLEKQMWICSLHVNTELRLSFFFPFPHPLSSPPLPPI
jgi:hypothetical protein